VFTAKTTAEFAQKEEGRRVYYGRSLLLVENNQVRTQALQPVEPPFVGAIHESPLLYMASLRKSCKS